MGIGVSQGQATRPLVLALAGLYGLTRPCDARDGRVNLNWPQDDGLIWPHLERVRG